MEDQLYVNHKIRWRLLWATAICCLTTLQFGFHLSVFNAPQQIISCQSHGRGDGYSDGMWARWGMNQCIPMDKSGIATINTVFTVAGFLSSTLVGSHKVLNSVGRNTVQKATAILYILGCISIAFANSLPVMNLGRFLAGVAAGSSMVVAPIFINEITPFNHRGLMGSLLQFGVATGILLAQLIAFLWSNDNDWRNLFIFGAGIGLLQLVLLFTTIESPKWLIMHNGEISHASKVLNQLRSDEVAAQYEILHWRRLATNQPSTTSSVGLSETSSLLESSPKDNLYPVSTAMSRRGSIDPSTLSPISYITGSKYKKEWIAVVLIMSAQQLSGMNAITFYGVSVLSKIVPPDTNVIYLTSSLALTNVIVSLAVSPLIDRWGRKLLLLASVTTMSLCSVIISTGLINQKDYMAAVGCFGFVIGFSVGLGQIPFLMISELSSQEAIGKAQALGTMSNWLSNVAIAYAFPYLKEILGDAVFFLFTVTGIIFFVAMYIYVPETKGREGYDEIWGLE